jgi:Fe-S cluster assembly iron-binding protein IscA
MSPEDLARALEALHRRSESLAETIAAPKALRPVITPDSGARFRYAIGFHEQDDGDDVSEHRYYLISIENGSEWVLAEAGLDYIDRFLFGVFNSIAHEMAMAQLGQPTLGEFDRAELFRLKEGFLRTLDPAWADEAARRHAYRLKN